MCKEIFYIYTFSNLVAFHEIIETIDNTKFLDSKQPKGIFYGIQRLDYLLQKDWDKHTFAIKKAYYYDECISCYEIKFDGWKNFRESIKKLLIYKEVFGIIKFKII